MQQFGHKVVHCKAYRKYKPKNVQRYKNNKNDIEKRNYNSFSPLQKYNVECHKCNNYGHKANECRLSKYSMKTSISNIQEDYKKTWRRKYEVQSKKDDEDIAPEINEVDNRRMMGEVPNKECKNQIFFLMKWIKPKKEEFLKKNMTHL
jgi:hypothetical protein